MHRLSIIIVVSCGSLPSISNGSPGTPTSTTFGGTGTYSCNTGYVLSGSATVNCEASGSWNTRPTCPRKIVIFATALTIPSILFCIAVSCGDPPNIPNGSRTFTGTTYGDMAPYTCNTGYQLSGSATVLCLASGNWDTLSTCLGIIIINNVCNKIYLSKIIACSHL